MNSYGDFQNAPVNIRLGFGDVDVLSSAQPP